jgi:hypothetical protein
MTFSRALLVMVVCAGTSACKPTAFFELARDPSLDGGIVVHDAGTVDSGRTGPRDASLPPLPEAATSDPDAAPFVPVARCKMAACACDDGRDNDLDGLTDGFDPECTGALDQDEATFATGNRSKTKACRDCFWDEDPGNGNDACRYPAECLRGETPRGAGNCSSCDVALGCRDTCAERTPNGCDCFGCCDVRTPSGTTVSVVLSESCSLEMIDDVEACPRCAQSTQCQNPCGPCELCPGKTARDLSADCRTNDAPHRCDPLVTVCASSADCSTDQYCQLGCCFRLLL